jgi:hypothetical protein
LIRVERCRLLARRKRLLRQRHVDEPSHIPNAVALVVLIVVSASSATKSPPARVCPRAPPHGAAQERAEKRRAKMVSYLDARQAAERAARG